MMQMKPIYHLLLIFSFVQSYSFAQIPCVNGMAGPYPCDHVDLLFHADVEQMGGATTNEIWGWTDSTYAKDYVIVGLSTGVRFYDISDPINPLYLGQMATQTSNSIWRTFRHLNDYLFVGSEASNHGMQVFDLTRLRNVDNPPAVFLPDTHYNGFGKCHTLSTLEGHPYVYAVGTNTFSGGLHVVDVSDPLLPTIAGGFAEDGYIHEIQLVRYQGPDTNYLDRILAFCYSGNNPAALTIVDVTDPLDMSIISSTTYANSSYCHQGWLTEDMAYLVMDDELDEMNGPFVETRTLIWDVQDLDNPQYMGDHLGTTEAIDHNQYIKGNLLYQSNYTAGLQILDIAQIADTSLTQVAFFDHYPANSATAFDGEWMNYPYFSSGVVAVSDIDNGFYLLQPNFIDMISADTICASDTWLFQVDLSQGFQGPYEVMVTGLPIEAIQNIIWASAYSFQVEVSNWPNTGLDYAIQMQVTGASHHYKRTVALTVNGILEQYIDTDQDGIGTGEPVWNCVPMVGFSEVTGDCNDLNAAIYPGAPGTADGIDNNCNNSIDPLEVDFCADLNGDGLVSLNDVLLFTDYYGCLGNCAGDLNDDGAVDVVDFLVLLADFGELCAIQED
jgi:choice-of-anchor B domain-containing protein